MLKTEMVGWFPCLFRALVPGAVTARCVFSKGVLQPFLDANCGSSQDSQYVCLLYESSSRVLIIRIPWVSAPSLRAIWPLCTAAAARPPPATHTHLSHHSPHLKETHPLRRAKIASRNYSPPKTPELFIFPLLNLQSGPGIIFPTPIHYVYSWNMHGCVL